MSPSKMLKFVSGGQTGVDRAALDVALKFGLEYAGWCPKNGLAEDMQEPPGLLEKYPNLKETEAMNYYERTRLNVKDSDVTTIIAPSTELAITGGSGYTIEQAEKYDKPCKKILLEDTQFEEQLKKLSEWIQQNMDMKKNKSELVINIAGPRASKAPGIYALSYDFLHTFLSNF